MQIQQQWDDTEVYIPGADCQTDWLDYLQSKRDALIMELRAIDQVLVKHRRLRNETLPRRLR